MKKTAFIFFLLLSISSCSSGIYLERIHAYLNASTPEQKSEYLGENFRSWFNDNGRDAGKTREEMLVSLMKWDGPLHPDVKILRYSRSERKFIVYFLERNDFSKLIGYPGWKGKAGFIFDSKKRVSEYEYFPDSTNLSYKPYLQPAITWLQKYYPNEVSTIYRNGKLIQNEVAAKRWIRLLTMWRNADSLNLKGKDNN